MVGIAEKLCDRLCRKILLRIIGQHAKGDDCSYSSLPLQPFENIKTVQGLM